MTRDVARLASVCVWVAAPLAARGAATLEVGPNVNASRRAGAEPSPAIALDPSDPIRLAVVSGTAGGALFLAHSDDGGASWTPADASDGTIADGSPGDPLPAACCDPRLAWDGFGNLFLVYLPLGSPSVAVAVSGDGGATFAALPSFTASTIGPPAVAVGPAGAAGGGAVWVAYEAGGVIVARGAAVTGAGAVGAFGAAQTAPGSAGGGGADIALGPSGQVLVAYQRPVAGEGPSDVVTHLDAGGLVAGGFGPARVATATEVGGAETIPAQPQRAIDASVGVAYDRSPGPRRGRAYLVYTDERPPESDDTDVLLRRSEDDGATWSAAVRVNDDATARSQFLPRVAVDQTTGAVAVSWYDARDDAGAGDGDLDGRPNTDTRLWAAVSVDGGESFLPAVRVAGGTSYAADPDGYGRRAGLTFHARTLHAAWADDSNSTADNPDATAAPDVYTARVTVVAPCFLDAECDDGESCNGAETCAAGSCRPGAVAPDGTVCDDGSRCTQVDRCAGGACVGSAPLVCARCLTCEPARGCAAVLRAACRRPLVSHAGKLVMEGRRRRDRLVWRWAKGAETAAADFGDPLARTSYELCVFDETAGSPQLVLSAITPAGGSCNGRPCWRRTRRGFRFADRDRSPEGLSRLRLRSGGRGVARIEVEGRGGALRLPPLPLALDPRATVQLASSEGLCWEATYRAARVNGARRFRARSE